MIHRPPMLPNMERPTLSRPWTDPNSAKKCRQKRKNVYYRTGKEANIPREYTHQLWKVSDTEIMGYINTDEPKPLIWFQNLVPEADFFKAPPPHKIKKPTCAKHEKHTAKALSALAVFQKKNHTNIKHLQQTAVQAYSASLDLSNYKKT